MWIYCGDLNQDTRIKEFLADYRHLSTQMLQCSILQPASLLGWNEARGFFMLSSFAASMAQMPGLLSSQLPM